jgi:hypothetical protein
VAEAAQVGHERNLAVPETGLDGLEVRDRECTKGEISDVRSETKCEEMPGTAELVDYRA